MRKSDLAKISTFKTIIPSKDIRSGVDLLEKLEEVMHRFDQKTEFAIRELVFPKRLTRERDFQDGFDIILLPARRLLGNRKELATLAEIFVATDSLGLKKCPSWVGPKLLIDYEDLGEKYFYIGMWPVVSSYALFPEDMHVFMLGPHKFIRAIPTPTSSSEGYPVDVEWAFIRPPKKKR